MDTELTEKLSQVFRDAVMEHAAFQMKSAQDWERFNAIKETAIADRKAEAEIFERDRAKRLDETRKGLIDRAGSLTFEHPTPHGHDAFNKDAIEAQAQQQVKHAFENRLRAIDQAETTAYAQLTDHIRAREAMQGRAQQGFARATERRSSPERRHPNRTR